MTTSTTEPRLRGAFAITMWALLLALGLATLTGRAVAQQKTLKEQLIGGRWQQTSP